MRDWGLRIILAMYLYHMRILIYGLAKSGTTALHIRIKQAMESDLNAEVMEVFEPVKRNGDDFVKLDGTSFPLAEHTLIKALMPTVAGNGATPESMLQDYSDFDKKIFINRDPRDRWISGFFYRWFHRHRPDEKEFERALRLTQFKEKNPSDVPFYALFSTSPARIASWKERQKNQLAGVDSFIDEATSRDWYILKYEDFMDGKLDELEDYLGLKISSKDAEDQRFSHVARSKGYGSWRRWFTPEDVEMYGDVFNPFLEKHGYDSTDWKLNVPTSLPSSEGSEYMYKLFHGHGAKRKKKKWRLFR